MKKVPSFKGSFFKRYFYEKGTFMKWLILSSHNFHPPSTLLQEVAPSTTTLHHRVTASGLKCAQEQGVRFHQILPYILHSRGWGSTSKVPSNLWYFYPLIWPAWLAKHLAWLEKQGASMSQDLFASDYGLTTRAR